MAGGAAAAVMGGVDGDAVKPGGKARLGPVAAKLRGQGKADVLGQVLCLAPLAGQAEGQRVDTVVMARDKRGEGRSVTVPRGLGQILICGFHAHHD